MSIPNPPFELAGHCTTIYNNVFYVYSPAGFASLPLQQNATWSTLASGVSVTNAECVKADTSNPAIDAFYVIGGTANATAGNYPGLQRYIFSTGKWETITPTVPVTQNRQNHGATYLTDTNSLFVYAGSQQASSSGMSSQTFLISTLPPFQVLSFNSAAPPLTSPMIMPLSGSKALMVGGAANSKAIYTWSKAEGWLNLGTTLPAPINPAAVQCNLVTGDDGTKVLEEYNMAATPNEVTRYVLLTPDGKPGAPGQTIGVAGKKRKRDLTLANWPAYNSSLAPVVARADYSLAESSNGLTVISGGNVLQPIAMFNSKQNSWINASTFLGKAEQVPLVSSTTSSALPSVTVVNNSAGSTLASAPTSTSTSANTIADAAAASDNTSSKTGKVLGATLGVVVGLGFALALALILIRHCKKRRQKKGQNYLNEKDDRMSFADQGADFMPQAVGARGFSAAQRDSKSTIGSLQFFNKTTRKSGHTRAAPSDASNLNLVMHAKSPLSPTDQLEMARMEKEAGLYPTFGPGNKGAGPAPKGRAITPTSATPTRSRSIGWSSYFTKSEPAAMPSSQASNRPFFGRKSVQDDRASAISGSDYGEMQSRVLSSSSTVRPLELNLGPKFEGQRLSQVSSGSPILESRGDHFAHHEQTAEIGHSGLYPGAINTSRYTANQNPFVSPLITDGASFTKPKVKDFDAKSISSIGSTRSQAYFQGGTNPYHENDPTLAYFPAKSPKTPTAPTFADHTTNPIPAFPRPAIGLPAHPGPVAKKSTTPQAYDFPLPKAYFASDGQARDSGASSGTNFTRGFPETPQLHSPAILQQPAAVAKPKVVQVRSNSPTAAEKKLGLPAGSVKASQGPQLRKMTGDEDMSWLNIGSG